MEPQNPLIDSPKYDQILRSTFSRALKSQNVVSGVVFVSPYRSVGTFQQADRTFHSSIASDIRRLTNCVLFRNAEDFEALEIAKCSVGNFEQSHPDTLFLLLCSPILFNGLQLFFLLPTNC